MVKRHRPNLTAIIRDKRGLYALLVRCPDLSKAHSIEVIRTLKNGELGSSKPCDICMSAIESTPIERILFT